MISSFLIFLERLFMLRPLLLSPRCLASRFSYVYKCCWALDITTLSQREVAVSLSPEKSSHPYPQLTARITFLCGQFHVELGVVKTRSEIFLPVPGQPNVTRHAHALQLHKNGTKPSNLRKRQSPRNILGPWLDIDHGPSSEHRLFPQRVCRMVVWNFFS